MVAPSTQPFGKAKKMVQRIPLTAAHEPLIEALRVGLGKTDRWNSFAVVENGTAVIGLRSYVDRDPAVADMDKGHVALLPYGWEINTYGTLSLTFFSKAAAANRQPLMRFVTFPGTEVFKALEIPSYRLMVFRGDRVIRYYQVNALGLPSEPVWNDAIANARKARSPSPVLHEALYWLTLKLIDAHKRHLSKLEHVRMGWAAELAEQSEFMWRELAKVNPEPFPKPNTPEAQKLFADLEATGRNPDTAGQLYYQTFSGLEFERFIAVHSDVTDTLNPRPDTHLFFMMMNLLALMSPEATAGGTRLPWLDLRVTHAPALQYTPVEPENFSVEACDEYFPRLAVFRPIMCWGEFLSGEAVPTNLEFISPAWESFPRAPDIDQAKEAAAKLMSEAKACRSGSVPPGAIIQQSFGIFTHFTAYERPTGVWFVAHTSAGEYALLCLEYDGAQLYFPQMHFRNDERGAAVSAALTVLLAGIVRDFWVVEERGRLFGTRGGGPLHPRPESAGSNLPPAQRIVYLPRVRYTAGSPPPDIARMNSELNHAARAEHDVAPHLRKSNAASQEQVRLAKFLGFTVPAGYTFVRGHRRGLGEQEIIYRSRSAMMSLYQVDTSIPEGRSDWFEFERTTKRFMEQLGFEVTHHSLARNGDEGIDLKATKGKDLDLVTWAIQCKCYDPTRRVGVSVIRDMLGALTGEPVGTRGMIVTTSTFTADAVELAARHNIRLVDGAELKAFLERS